MFALVFLVVIGGVALLGAGAIGAARDMSVKQQRELDSAIDRIVAEHKERREAAPSVAVNEPKTEVAADEAKTEFNVDPATVAKPPVNKQAAEAQLRNEVKSPSSAPAQKNSRPRTARYASRSNSLIPQAFLSLPKFAAATLFGFR
jgi:hypothetical protein